LPADVVHLLFQGGRPSRRPFIYHPHDLQHRHLPEFFSKRSIAAREVAYKYMCQNAAVVAVGTSWVKQDVQSSYQLAEDKVVVVPLAPVLSPVRETPDQHLEKRLQVLGRYALYPAANWPHKNHEQLFAAWQLLVREDEGIQLVLSGPRHGGVDLAALARANSIDNLVTDLGYLGSADHRHVLANASIMVVPTLFESASFPVWEAMMLGVPVACSNVTSLPAQVEDAALLFSPNSVEGMASAIRILRNDRQTVELLIGRGRKRVRQFTWESTASKFCALYRKCAGRELSKSDIDILTARPTI
jgi:glycosyltransferase involved in cell wall biosynthesis